VKFRQLTREEGTETVEKRANSGKSWPITRKKSSRRSCGGEERGREASENPDRRRGGAVESFGDGGASD